MEIDYQCGPHPYFIEAWGDHRPFYYCNGPFSRPRERFESVDPPLGLVGICEKLFGLAWSQEVVIRCSDVDYSAGLIQRSVLVEPHHRHFINKNPGQCHRDAIDHFNPATQSFYTGFGLSEDQGVLTWFRHSWLMNPDASTIYETTAHNIVAHFGCELSPADVENFRAWLLEGAL